MSDHDVAAAVPVISANDLRALAEESDALRNVAACVVVNGNPGTNGHAYRVVPEAEAAAQGWAPLIRLETRDNPQLGTAREKVTFSTDRPINFGGIAKDINECDAIFTSLPAIEKFVVPYYARMRGLAECEAMRLKFAGNASVVALIHLPTSIEDSASAGFLPLVPDETKGKDALKAIPMQELLDSY